MLCAAGIVIVIVIALVASRRRVAVEGAEKGMVLIMKICSNLYTIDSLNLSLALEMTLAIKPHWPMP